MLRFYTIPALVLGSVVKGEGTILFGHDIEGFGYGLHGWKDSCGGIPKECDSVNPWPYNITTLNECINKGNPYCNKLVVEFHMDSPYSMVPTFANKSINSFVVKVEKPLYPGTWRFIGGEVVTESGRFESPPRPIIGMQESIILFKEGELSDDFTHEDISKWTKMDCKHEPEIDLDLAYHYPFSCSDTNHEVLSKSKRINLLFVDKQGKPIEWFQNEARKVRVTFRRTETAPSQIPQITIDKIRYSMKWGDQCHNGPFTECADDLPLPYVKQCLDFFRHGACKVMIQSDIDLPDLSPTPLFINGVLKHIPAVYIDASQLLLLTDYHPVLHWKEPTASYSFGPNVIGPTDIFVSTNLGDLSGKLDKKYQTNDDESKPQYFNSGFDVNKAGGRYISLDKSLPPSQKFDFTASFDFIELTYKPRPTIPTPNPDLGITIIDKEHADYLITYGELCLPHPPEWCHQTIKHNQVAKCLEIQNGACQMTMKVIVPSANRSVPFKPVKTNIDGQIVESPVVFFDPEEIFVFGSLPEIHWFNATLDAFSFDLPGLADVFISHKFGGNPATGKVLSQVQLKENEQYKKAIPIEINGGQYIYLKHEDKKAGEFSAVFSISTVR